MDQLIPDESSLPPVVRKRIKVSGLFTPLDRNAERRWARVFRNGFAALEEKLEALAHELQFEQKRVADDYLVWLDPETQVCEAMFRLIEDAQSLEVFQDVYAQIEKSQAIFTYAILHQKKDGEGTYDIFRLSVFSYLEHCNRVKVPGT